MRKFAVPFALATLLAISTTPLNAGKSRETRPLISFHLEAQEDDRPRKTTRVIIGTKTFRVRLAPEFSMGDIEGYYPFLSDDGHSMAAAFKLTPRASKRLLALSAKASGSKLFTVAGTDTISYVVFNGPIEDGYIVCWKGLSLEHMDKLKESGLKKIKPSNGSAEDNEAPEYVPPAAAR